MAPDLLRIDAFRFGERRLPVAQVGRNIGLEVAVGEEFVNAASSALILDVGRTMAMSMRKCRSALEDRIRQKLGRDSTFLRRAPLAGIHGKPPA
jgi:hypothetical protein